jgi:hypothetical protein
MYPDSFFSANTPVKVPLARAGLACLDSFVIWFDPSNGNAVVSGIATNSIQIPNTTIIFFMFS